MRKMFNTLKSLVATAVMVSMLGTASLATSCVDEYDDTEIRNDLSSVKKELADLTKRVANLETKLNSEVAALKSMIDGLNVVVSADKVGDDWKITLADGTEFTVYGPCDFEDTDTDTDVDTSLVPKKDTDGVYYWAVVDDTLGEELTEEWLLVDGQKVPVFGAAECDCEPSEPCTCEPAELKFDVDATTGNLLVSIDGGKTYVDSGIKAENVCNCDPNAGGTTTEGGNCIIEDVDLWSEPGYAIFTLAGGETVKVEIAQDGAGIIANIKSGRMNFAFGEEKSADLSLENVVDIAVMTKPEGWRAKIEGNKLTITAPTEEAVTGGAEAEGTIRLHATSDEGQCKIAKLKVSTNQGITIEVDPKTGDMTITNPMVVEVDYGWQIVETFQSFRLGFAPLKTFEADPTAYLENLDNNYEDVHFYGDNLFDGYYEAGVCEVMVIETTVADAYYFGSYTDIPEGEQFAVWACPVDTSSYELTIEDMVYGVYKPAVNKVEQLSTSFCDVEVSIQLSGADSYEYVVGRKEDWVIADGSYDPIESALAEWKSYKPMYEQYGMTYYFGYGVGVVGDIDFEGSLAEFQTAGLYEADLLKPNTEYVLVVLPVEEGKAYDDYVAEDVQMYEFKTSGIVAGGNSTITITPTEVGYTSLKASIEYSDDVIAAYWNFFDPATEEIVAGGDTMANYMLEKGNITTYFPTNASKTYGLAMGQTLTLAVMALNAEGEYTLKTLDMTTATMQYSEETVAIDAIEPLNNSIAVTLSVSGGNVVKYRAYPLASYNLNYYTEEDIKNTLLTNSDDYYSYSTVKVADGTVTGKSGSWDADTNTLTINNCYNGTAYTVFVAAQFEDGTWSANMASAEATPQLVLDPFFDSKSTEYSTMQSTIGEPLIITDTIVVDGSYNEETQTFSGWLEGEYKFDKITEGMTVYAYVGDEETMSSQGGQRDKNRAAYVVDNGTALKSATETITFFINNGTKSIYYVVLDAEGNYYGLYTYSLEGVWNYFTTPQDPGIAQ